MVGAAEAAQMSASSGSPERQMIVLLKRQPPQPIKVLILFDHLGSRLLPASRLGPSGLPTPGLDRTQNGTGGYEAYERRH